MARVKIGFVPSFRFRYTPWTAKMRADSLAAFAQVPGMEVVVPQPGPDETTIDAQRGLTPHGAVNTLDQGEAVAEHFAREGVDGLILCPLDFGDERSAAKIAERLRVPVLLYATKEPEAPADDPGLRRISDSYCGNLSMASGLYRRKITFHYAGIYFPHEPEFRAEVETFVRAVAVVKALKGARLGQVGVRPSTFETVGYNEAALIEKFGQNVIYAELADLVQQALALPDDDPRVQQALAEARNVAQVTVGDDYLRKSAKLEVALAEFFRTWRLSAMAIQCWPSIQQQLGISMCALYGRLTQRGMLTACETDMLGAVAMMVNYHAALGEIVPHFIDWTIQHRQDPNRLLAWHCGNAPVSLARDPHEVALRSRGDMIGALGVREGDPQAGLFQFQLKPGPVTFCRLAEYDNRWKMLIAQGEIVSSDETLTGTWSWVQVPDHARLYRTLVEEGFIHHASMIHGDQMAALQQVCKFLDITPVVVA